MGQKDSYIGQQAGIQLRNKDAHSIDFVLEKSIFHSIFEKDIRRAYIYKKAERLGKAAQLISPAFTSSPSLKNRFDSVAVNLIESALLPVNEARTALSKELLTLSSLLSLARTGGFLSAMNVDLINREAHILLQEMSSYEEPRVYLEEVPTLSSIARDVLVTHTPAAHSEGRSTTRQTATSTKPTFPKGHVKDNQEGSLKDRQEAVLSVIRTKGKARIKDISMVVRGVSEKTIQRELSALVSSGRIVKEGERRWSTYSLS
jgi:hypothetical protein